MIKIDSSSGRLQIEATGDTMHLTAEIAGVINSLYNKLSDCHPAAGAQLREGITALVMIPDSPMWERITVDGHGIVAAIPIRHKEGQ